MNAKDQFKVLKAGFTIIRKEVVHVVSHEYRRVIKAKTPDRVEWFVLEKDFKTTVELDRKMKKLLELSKIIED